MIYFKKGLLAGLGFLTALLPMLIAVCIINAKTYSGQQISTDIEYAPYSEYTWFDDTDLSKTQFDKLIGNGIIQSISAVNVKIGEEEASYDGGRTRIMIPVYQKGIKISFVTNPTIDQLNTVDLLLSIKNMKRDGGKTVIDSVKALEVRAK
jgi:hypothetical protein